MDTNTKNKAVPPFKVGNELARYHPSASHCSPDYRDGWNACFDAWQARASGSAATPIEPAMETLIAVAKYLGIDEAEERARPGYDGKGPASKTIIAAIERKLAGSAAPAPEPAAIAEWRKARAASIAAVETYNAAIIAARALDEIKGFGFGRINGEFAAMTEASNLAYRLTWPALDALYALGSPATRPAAGEPSQGSGHEEQS